MKSVTQESAGERDCYTVLHDVDAAMRDVLAQGQQYYVLGGIASSALVAAGEGTIIDDRSHSIIADATSALPTRRPNGTQRDIDILVAGVLRGDTGEQVKQQVAKAIGGQLVVSVFGFDEYHEQPGWRGRLALAGKEWISHRTVDDERTLRYELFPLERTVAPESYEPWKLMLPSGQTVDVLHPAGHVLAYGMRSISGVRAKDRAKVDAMRAHVLPLFRKEVKDGPFREWAAFADDIAVLGGLQEAASGALHDTVNRSDAVAFKKKAQLLRWLQEHENVVDFAQGDRMQRLLNVFVRAQ